VLLFLRSGEGGKGQEDPVSAGVHILNFRWGQCSYCSICEISLYIWDVGVEEAHKIVNGDEGAISR
jgi:hypothetical protein